MVCKSIDKVMVKIYPSPVWIYYCYFILPIQFHEVNSPNEVNCTLLGRSRMIIYTLLHINFSISTSTLTTIALSMHLNDDHYDSADSDDGSEDAEEETERKQEKTQKQ